MFCLGLVRPSGPATDDPKRNLRGRRQTFLFNKEHIHLVPQSLLRHACSLSASFPCPATFLTLVVTEFNNFKRLPRPRPSFRTRVCESKQSTRQPRFAGVERVV